MTGSGTSEGFPVSGWSNLFVKRIQSGERVIHISASANFDGMIVFTDKAIYYGPTYVPGFRLDLSRARRQPWADVARIEIRTPLWLLPFGCIGFRIVLKGGGSKFFAGSILRRWFRFRDTLHWPVKHCNLWWDRPGICELRQAATLILACAALVALVVAL